MQKLATFFYSLKQTFTSPAYYADVVKSKFTFSLRFFYGFFFFYAIVATVIITVQYFFPLNDLIQFLPDKLAQVYPDDLVITIKDGEASINQPEPYKIPLSRIENLLDDYDKKVLGQNTEAIEYLLVIDTNASLEDFHEYQTYSLLTGNYITFLNDEGNIESASLADFGDITIDRNQVETFIDVVRPFLQYLVPLLVVGTFFLIFIFVPPSMLIYLLFFSVVLFVIGKLLSVPLSYKKSYQIGLHLVVISTTLLSIANWVGLFKGIPFLRTIILTVIGLVVLTKVKDDLIPPAEDVSPSESPTPGPLVN